MWRGRIGAATTEYSAEASSAQERPGIATQMPPSTISGCSLTCSWKDPVTGHFSGLLQVRWTVVRALTRCQTAHSSSVLSLVLCVQMPIRREEARAKRAPASVTQAEAAEAAEDEIKDETRPRAVSAGGSTLGADFQCMPDNLLAGQLHCLIAALFGQSLEERPKKNTSIRDRCPSPFPLYYPIFI